MVYITGFSSCDSAQLPHMRFLDFLRQQLLRILFPVSVFWLLIVLFTIWGEFFHRLNYYQEGTFAYKMFEELVVWLPALLGSSLSILLIMHRRSFLLLTPSTPLAKTLLHYIGRVVELFNI